MDLEAVYEISRVKYRYLRGLDTKDWDLFADTMLPETTATYSEYLQFESREAFVGFMRNTLGPHVITEHHCDHPEIEINGDSATGVWYQSDTVLIPEHNMLMKGAAYYDDRYVRGIGRSVADPAHRVCAHLRGGLRTHRLPRVPAHVESVRSRRGTAGVGVGGR